MAVRPGLTRDTIAGMAWVLLRLRGCMAPGELLEELRRVGVEVGRNRLTRVLLEYNGRLYKRVKEGSTVRYCAVEEV
ncbi:hypothetical protein [Pyrodictium delaneyi]|uniref:hypothetical protein n=1 Tax=Pyrodictium delaneyi TaxID=1273541 RepID=UPI001C5AF131|nr:hypothetical protein [Pyrodictium delaneyi]